GVRRLRTGLSWADSHRPNALAWFDRQMRALERFDVTLTFCFTPPSRGIREHYTSPPQAPQEFADFCAQMTRRYASLGEALQPPRVALDRGRAAYPPDHQQAVGFAPRPDGGVIGLGGQRAPRAPWVHVVYGSDGAPENPAFVRDLGFSERTEYAGARRREGLA